jgi:uncharacterized protein YjaG (DUF416 family)
MSVVIKKELIRRLRKLSHQHQLLFACCCCERVIPNYRDFAEDQGWEEVGLLEQVMKRLWAAVNGKDLSDTEINAISEKVDSMAPDEDACQSWFLGAAQDAATMVLACLEFHAERQKDSLEEIANYALESVKEWILLASDYNPNDAEGKPDDRDLARRLGLKPPCGANSACTQEEAENECRRSRLVQAELDKQRFDVEVLEIHPLLTKELIELLRRSSSMQGVQLRQRGLRAATPRHRNRARARKER